MNRILMVAAIITAALGLTLNAADTAPKLTEKAARELVASAKTPADHLKIASYYTQMAEKFLSDAKSHEQMKAGYQSNATYQSSKLKGATLDHCDYFIKSSRENGQKAKELAALHEEMAKAGGNK